MKMIVFLFFAVVMPCVAMADDATPIPATIEQIVQDPMKYADKNVRIRGQVDNCISLTCNLCPIDMKVFGQGCLGLDFLGYSDDGAGSRTSALMERAFRFATVEMDTSVDPTCLENYEKAKQAENPSLIIVCTDRATVLTDARVIKVLARKSALDGLVSGYEFGPLVTAPPRERRLMLAELGGETPRTSVSTAAFIVVGLSSPKKVTGLVCVCLTESCEGRWPTRWFGGFDSPANPFLCTNMTKTLGRWRVASPGTTG